MAKSEPDEVGLLGDVIDPANRPPGDVRPVFDKATLPGGPWFRYRSVQYVDAVHVPGPFLIRRPDGMLVEVPSGWVTIDTTTGQPNVLTETAFAQQYQIEE